MATAKEITITCKKLNGELPNGRLYEGKPGTDGRMIYRNVNAKVTNRPDNWRKRQSGTPLSDNLRGR